MRPCLLPGVFMSTRRLTVLACLTGLWVWAGSVFSPWAEDLNPRLWLFDSLFYSGFILLFWFVVEAALWLRSFGEKAMSSGRRLAGACLLSLPALFALTTVWLAETQIGWQWRVRLSMAALASHAAPEQADFRHRVGLFLVDTQRMPCADQSWLWLGRPFGGGTGTNLALVHGSRNAVPKSPQAAAFRFLHMHDNWWLAYQNPDSYSAETDGTIVCVEGRSVASHAQGLRFIDSLH